MAESTISSGNIVTNFQAEVYREYVRGGKFGKYIGPTPNAMIQVNRDLKKHSIPLIAKLTGNGVRGNTLLGGNEEALSNYDFTFTPEYIRHGVLITNEENEKAEFDLFQEGRPALMNWGMERKRDHIIQALGAVVAGTTYANYGGTDGSTGAGAATAANMDTWVTNNTDRILYGAAKSNLSSGDHTTSLATIDTTADKMDRDMVELLKRMAGQANPLIRPITLKGDEPWYVLFLGSYAFRDLRADLDTEHQNAAARSMTDNPIWTGGDLVVDGVIVKEIPEIDIFIDGDGTGSAFDGVWGANAAGDSLATGGDSSSRVGVGFLCGAQACVMGMGREASFERRKEDDYGHLNGVGISMKHDLRKTFFNSKQHGVLTTFHSAAADS